MAGGKWAYLAPDVVVLADLLSNLDRVLGASVYDRDSRAGSRQRLRHGTPDATVSARNDDALSCSFRQSW